MNIAKFVMALFSFAALLSMIAIGYAIAIGKHYFHHCQHHCAMAVFGIGFQHEKEIP